MHQGFEKLELTLGLELGVTDIPLLLQDKRLDEQGRLVYAPSAEEMIPMDIPRLPVDPTAMLYWLKNCLNSGVSNLR